MGWGSGSEVMSDIITEVKKKFRSDAKLRQQIYSCLIPAFGAADCDTLDECREEDPAFTAALDARDNEKAEEEQGD
jgi:hypothetical protein